MRPAAAGRRPGRARAARTPVLTSYLDEGEAKQAMRHGAPGRLLEHAGTATVLDELPAPDRGEMPPEPEAARLPAEGRGLPRVPGGT